MIALIEDYPPSHASIAPLYIGIDVAKNAHVAAFISHDLLQAHSRYERCPTMSFENSRTGFDCLITEMKQYADLRRCSVLLEKTGHYHAALLQYLQEQGVMVYRIHVQKRPKGRHKSDKRDAQRLANALYSHVELGVQVSDVSAQIRKQIQPKPVAVRLRGLVRHRYELAQEINQRRNKLTSICDELFPEFSTFFADVNGLNALRIREQYPLPAQISAASLDDLLSLRIGRNPGRKTYLGMREAATTSIGQKEQSRTDSLVFEQGQLITELRLLQFHQDELDTRITELVTESREGHILLSMKVIGPVMAGTLVAYIGDISNFETPAKLRGYCGWAPVQHQTGQSKDSSALTKGGQRPLKQTLYIIGMQAVKQDTAWREVYQHLIPLKCSWDERKQQWKGKSRVLGHIIGQIIGLIWKLLKADEELLASLAPGEEPPPPMLYDRGIHQGRRRSS